MIPILDAITRGMGRGFVAVLAVGALAWAVDRAFGRREP